MDPSQTTYNGSLEISNELFPSGHPSGNLLGPSETTVKQQLPEYKLPVSLPGASGTAVKQRRASNPSGKLPVPFRNSTKWEMGYLRQCVCFRITQANKKTLL